MRNQKLHIFGLNGNAHTAPMDTMVAYWAAMGAGGTGFIAGLHLNKSESVVCCPSATLQSRDGESMDVLDLTDEQIRRYDAGAAFQSIVLDADYQPTGDMGKNHPWKGNPKKGDHLYHPRLVEVLRMFGRRTHLLLMMQADQGEQAANTLVEQTLKDLQSFGLAQRVTIIAPEALCSKIREKSTGTPLALIAPSDQSIEKSIQACKPVKADYLFASIESVIDQTGTLTDMLLPVKLLLSSAKTPVAPTPGQLAEMMGLNALAGLCFRSVESCLEMVTPPAQVLADNFEGTAIDRTIWTCGYSHQNQDTQISQCDGLTIEIKQGGSYSGGAAVTLLPIHGRFDARVDFHVAHPHQGTTFEMAAIGIDPGYFHIDNTDLNSRTVNLTFDVHGAPPYASSERDEDDGFRLGWNNGYNLTKVDADWTAASVNMYNKYSRDVGNGAVDNPTGTLRLVRSGSVFNAYCKDKYNDEWVCTGSELIPNLGPDIHLRLAAKHWNKGGKQAPHNQVTFFNFRVFQF
jgi:hypothetical protein